MRWQVQEAKQKFSEVVRRALSEGPQVVTRHGADVVIVIDAEEFRRMTGQSLDFKDFLRSAPALEELHLTRDEAAAPAIELPV
jgi:prevent-host-death family protein